MAMGIENYKKALKLGKKEYQNCIAKGISPTLTALDQIIPASDIQSVEPVGIVQIPLEQIAGTRYSGRTSAFAPNFMPLLEEGSEFAQKWSNLSKAHEEEGIRDAIKVVEYMHRYYVEEGNKRVSVMKFFDAVSIPGNVTRIIPKRTEEKENKLYFEYLDFYKLAPVNYLWFSQEGSYKKLQNAVGKGETEVWSEEDLEDFASVYYRFGLAYKSLGGAEAAITQGDAFLTFLTLFSYDTLQDLSASELKEMMQRSWKEITVLPEDDTVELKLDPEAEKKKRLSKLLPVGGKQKVKVGFIYAKTPTSSSWAYAHELGRLALEEHCAEEIVTVRYENAGLDTIDRFLELAIHDQCKIIFTTSPIFAKASVKAAIAHPEVHILNCSLNTSHHYIRTYYSRMHEAKFLMGAIAGAMAENDKIVYIADYPLYGNIAHINAFALGAEMVNPRAKIYLEWSTLRDYNVWEHIDEIQPSCILGKDMMTPENKDRYFGLYHIKDGEHQHIAMPLCEWGKIYEKLVRTILDGTWKKTEGSTKAINYWWGMSSGMVDVVCSKSLPSGIRRLVDLLTDTIKTGEFHLFSGTLYSQDGIVNTEDHILTPEEIMKMDWLAANVIGKIPQLSMLQEQAKPVIAQQGLPGKKE